MIAVALLAWRVGAASPRRAAALGFAFGTAWLCAGTWWMFVSMHRYGGLPAPLAALAVLGLAAFLSLYLAAAMALVARWPRRRPRAAAWCSPPPGCWPSSRAPSCSRASRGSRAATRRSTRRSPASRRGSASMASAPLSAALAARFGFADLRHARALDGRQRARARRRRRLAARPARLLDADAHAGDLAPARQRPAAGEVRARPFAEGLAATAAQIQARAASSWSAPETVIPVLVRSSTTSGGRGCSSASARPGARRSSACRWATPRTATRTRQSASRPRRARCRGLLPLRQAPPRPVRRVRADGLSLVHAT